MLKNINWSELLTSKTFIAALFLSAQQGLQAFQAYGSSHDKAALANTLLTILGAMLAAVGIIDRTATPNTGKD